MATVADTSESMISPALMDGLNFPSHRLSVDRYIQMIEAGVFQEDEPIFLWRGRLAEKMTKGPDHTVSFLILNSILPALIPEGWHLRPEQAIRMNESLPEPDFAIVRGKIRDYQGRYPSAPDAALIIEVADSSVGVDSGDVLETYAAEAIPIYWIVNIPKRRIEVYREPTGPSDRPGYQNCRHFVAGDRVPVVLDGREVGTVDVSEILP